MKTFTILSEHLKLLRRAYIGWEDCEYGAPAIDCKRPYGNGDVEGDIFNILGWKPEGNTDGYEDGYTEDQHEKARQLHYDLETVLQIAIIVGKFEEGTYKQKKEYDYRSWEKIENPELLSKDL